MVDFVFENEYETYILDSNKIEVGDSKFTDIRLLIIKIGFSSI